MVARLTAFQRDAAQVETGQLEALFTDLNRQLLAMDPHEFGKGSRGQDYVLAMGELMRRGADPLVIRQEIWDQSALTQVADQPATGTSQEWISTKPSGYDASGS